MTAVINIEKIKSAIKHIDLVVAMENAFIQYSNGNAVVPPVGELILKEREGEAHIKYGYIKNEDYYVVKIASGFYQNEKLGLSSSQGLMLLFAQESGVPKAILLDEGYLTDLRTAAAGALAAKYFAPKNVHAIGIIGTGIQARLQLLHLRQVTSCNEVWVWGRSNAGVRKFIAALSDDYIIHHAKTPKEVALHANLIVTTTPSQDALLQADDIQAGTHITAVGSDMASKQELSSELLHKADLLVADSVVQSQSRGEIYRAHQDLSFTENKDTELKVTELGSAIQTSSLQRQNDHQISIVDLTGVAVQDIMIATAVINHIQETS